MPSLPETTSRSADNRMDIDSSSPVKTTRDTSPPEVNLIPSSEMNKSETLRSLFDGSEPTDSVPSENGQYRPSSSDMLYYYERLLPFKSIFQWLNHSPAPTPDFVNREFAFEFKSGAYQRYNSFTGYQDFKQTVVKLNPTRFEVGAIYTVPPNQRKVVSKNVLRPLEKELVFDIDLTDYDEVRTCCSKTLICNKCWKFIDLAIELMELGLRDDFGFKNLIWVFSGRRGIHCWVCDKSARQLTDPQRRAIIEYFDISKDKVLRKPFHPMLQRSYEVIYSKYTKDFLEDQGVRNEFLIAKLTESGLFTKQIITDIEKYLSEHPKLSGMDKLNSLEKSIPLNHHSKALLLKNFNNFKKDFLLFCMYPRLDLEVSKQVHHLLKSPFAVHPGTGNLSVPVHLGFDPVNALNLKDLIAAKEGEAENNAIPRFEAAVKLLDDFAKELIHSEGVKKREADPLEF